MHISDWSSDVCSSDLVTIFPDTVRERARRLHAKQLERRVRFEYLISVGQLDEALTPGNGARGQPSRLGAADQPLAAEAGCKAQLGRSEEGRVGKEGGRTWRSMWLPVPQKKKK